MSCWCGHRPWHHWHGPWHHYGYGYGPPGPEYRPGYGYGPPRRRRAREEDLAEYLQDLEEEIGQVREELERLRRSRGGQET